MTATTPFPSSRKIQWIHPSYRDLVVEQLSSDATLRARFLHSMDLEGLKLAVSQAGGKSGDRRLPLLVTDKDWDILAARTLELLNKLTVPQSISLLTVLRSATVDLKGSDRTQLVGVLESCCREIRKKLDITAHPIRESHLRELFDATILIDPLPVMPKLGPTWKSATAAMRTTITKSNTGSYAVDAEVLHEWAKLAQLLSQNEPRFMRQVNFPDAFTGDMSQLLVIAQREAKIEEDFEDSERCLAEANRVSTLEEALKILGSLLPRSADKILELRSLLSSLEDQLRQQYRDLQPESDEGYDEDEDQDEESSSAQPFDLDALFADL
jgi:hypothetical protein